MSKHSFVDYVKLFLRSGKGGDGVVRWRKEKYVPKGGPDGGDGGKGGSIILQGDSQIWTLLDLKYRKHIRAEDGTSGSGSLKTGKDGKDIILKVPLGTIVKNHETGEQLLEIKEDGETKVLVPGGNGGLGNFHFRSATNQAPERRKVGQPAQDVVVIFELKILADVGLVGFPNAGKSTLLSVVSSAKPKIGAYPFTTLVPNLGIVRFKTDHSFVMADIPGIIEGAHLGKGLGTVFLRHIERNPLLFFLVPADSEDIVKEYEILLNELKAYNPELIHKERILGISKSDLITEEGIPDISKIYPDLEVVTFSSVTQTGIENLKEVIWKYLKDGSTRK